LTFGLGTREDGAWHGVTTLYFRPFRPAWQILKAQIGRRKGEATDEA